MDATYAYDPYGQLTAMTSNGPVGINNPWRYVSAYQDGTGLYKLGARYYDPSQGRFTQQDPIHDPLDPKSWNRYIYVGNDPTNFVDPTGLSHEDVYSAVCTGWVDRAIRFASLGEWARAVYYALSGDPEKGLPILGGAFASWSIGKFVGAVFGTAAKLVPPIVAVATFIDGMCAIERDYRDGS